ncbi:hypothetical protein R69919_05103 [Paraburkholderia gardini]|nr:hypothetical protein R69919_05103 [Paraburkholderia gardini]
MDIRQIQALHAQYSSQPVMIDLAGHSAAMPALPAPDTRSGQRWHSFTPTFRLRQVGKPLAIFLAIAALAGGGGMSVAKLWKTMHSHLSTQATPPVPPAASQVHAIPRGDMPINVAPPRPLTSADLGDEKPAPTSALANVDAQALATAAAPAARPAVRASDPAPDPAIVRAAASPIRAQNPVPVAQPAAAQSTVGQTAQPVVSQPAAQAPHAERAPTQPSAPDAASAVEAPARPAPRAIHHVTAHHPAKSEDPASAQPVTQPTTSNANPGPATKAGSKGGDVQLF